MFKVYNPVVLSIYTKLCNHHHHLIPQHSYHLVPRVVFVPFGLELGPSEGRQPLFRGSRFFGIFSKFLYLSSTGVEI